VSLDGVETLLYTFTGGPDGAYPAGSLVRDASGNLYGVTSQGGLLSCKAYPLGCGTIFKVDSSGKETVLYSFSGGSDGAIPTGSLLRDSAGNLYGTTQSGGRSNGGVVFRLDPNNNLTVLYNFRFFRGYGASPNGALVRDTSGNLYGTTYAGGGPVFCGTVFKISQSGVGSVLHSFDGTDGCGPRAGLTPDDAGNLYGTTEGTIAFKGTAFKLSFDSGMTTVLHTFGSTNSDGCYPDGALVRDSAGNLYGNTLSCGDAGHGTTYKIDPGGTETILYNFTGQTDGWNPWGTLAIDPKGTLYGVTNRGGADGQGEVFKLTP
jgi:uncharacterized repeat protein (TIGR03803 family)